MNPPASLEEKYMAEALRLAERAAEAGEVPVGALIVREGHVIGRAHNQVEMLHDATDHFDAWRRDLKKDLRISEQRSPRMPLTTGMRWLSRFSFTMLNTEPQAPAIGSSQP